MKDYKKSCNVYLTWLGQNYLKTESEEDFVTSDELLGEWRKDNPRSRETDKAIQMKLADALKEWGISRERKRIEGEIKYIYRNIRKTELLE